MNELEKYELVWSRVERYGKDWTDTGLARTVKGWLLQHFEPGASVTDFGCGNGSSLRWLESQGFTAHGVEIASNATTHPNVTFGDLREPLGLAQTDHGICTDVMEHIPTDDVGAVIEQIAATVRCSVFFGIARDEDKDGAAVGQVLHLTRKPKEWWDAHILRHFASVEVMRYVETDESAYCFFAHHGP